MDSPTIPMLQIRPGCLLLYNMSYSNYLGSSWSDYRHQHDKIVNEKYTGKMNNKSRSKLRFAINLLLAQAKTKQVQNPATGKFYKFKINFITLTLSAPQKTVSDRIVKSKILEPWLKNMRNVQGLRSYVWRAERQKNGNIHFHITSDTFIQYNAIRDAWNLHLGKFHFITDFQEKNKSIFPNSTDVHSVRNVKDLASYLVKYMVKDEKGLDSIQGKVWDCSKNLKLKDRVCFEMDCKDFELIDYLVKKFPDNLRENDNCSLFQMSDSEMQAYLPKEYYTQYLAWIEKVYEAGNPGSYYRVDNYQI